jgi:uncharacterized protein
MPSDEQAIVPISELNFAALLELNNNHARDRSLPNRPKFELLVRKATYAYCTGGSEAFLLAFDSTAQYDSPNYIWFCERYLSFIYIDRIIVAPECRNQGLAGALFANLLVWAVTWGHRFIGCAVNESPRDLTLEAFHRAMGFSQVGVGCPRPDQRVRYLLKTI